MELFGEVVKGSRKEAMYLKLVEIRSCCLHIVHGSLETALDKNNLRIKKALETAIHLSHDTPARRVEDTALTNRV